MHDPRDILELEFLLLAKLQEEWAKIAPAQFKPVSDAIAAEDWHAANEAATLIDAGDIGPEVKDFAYTIYRGMVDHGARTAADGDALTSSLDFDDEVRSVVSQLLQHIQVSMTMAAQDAALQLIAEARTDHVLKFNPYHDAQGQFTTKDKAVYFNTGPAAAKSIEQAKYVHSLKLPPAWTNVWVNPDRQNKLVATGYDAKGRKQSRYSKDHAKSAEAEKFGRLVALNKALPDIRKKLVDGLKNKPTDHLAVLRLIERTGIRIGSEDGETDIRDKLTGEKTATTTYGATTLLAKHVRVAKDGTINLEFLGKAGKTNTREFKDKPLSDYLKTKLEGRGPEDSLFSTSDSAIRGALGKIVKGFKPKDFRTWHGTNEALKELANHNVAVSDADMKKLKLAVSKKVSEFLNNTPAVALSSYINPAVFDKHTGKGYQPVKKADELLDEDDQRMTEFLAGVIWDDLGDWESTPESEPDDREPVEKANPYHDEQGKFTNKDDAGKANHLKDLGDGSNADSLSFEENLALYARMQEAYRTDPDFKGAADVVSKYVQIQSHAVATRLIVAKTLTAKSPDAVKADKAVVKAVEAADSDGYGGYKDHEVDEVLAGSSGYYATLRRAEPTTKELFRGSKKVTVPDVGGEFELRGPTAVSEYQDSAMTYAGGMLFVIKPGATAVPTRALEGVRNSIRAPDEYHEKTVPAFYKRADDRPKPGKNEFALGFDTDREMTTSGRYKVVEKERRPVFYVDTVSGKRMTKNVDVVVVEQIGAF